MNHLLLSVILGNIFYFGHYVQAENKHVFDNFNRTYLELVCPTLENTVLFNEKFDYLKTCTDVDLNSPPKTLTFPKLKDSLCVGVFDSDIRLCNTLAHAKNPPFQITKDDVMLKVREIQKNPPKFVCNQLQTDYTTFVNHNNKLTEWTSVLYTHFNTKCERICADIESNPTNELCSMIYLINSYIRNITVFEQNKTVLPPLVAVPNTPTPLNTTVPKFDPKITQKHHNSSESADKKLTNPEKTNTDRSETQTEVKIIPKLIKSLLEPLEKVQNVNVTKTQPTMQPNLTEKVTNAPAVIVPAINPVQNNTQIKITVPQTSIKQVDTSKIVADTMSDPRLTDRPALELITVLNEEKLDSPYPKESLDTGKITKENFDPSETDPRDLGANDEPEKKPDDVVRPVDPGLTVGTFDEDDDSNFFSYFMFISIMFIFGYVVYHNKQKILALLLEGRRDRNSRRRPSTSTYRKLNSNLEEAVTSKCSGSASHVIY